MPDFEDTEPMHSRANDPADTGIRVNRVVPLWGIIGVVGIGFASLVQSHYSQEDQAKSIATLEKSVVALTVKLDGILATQQMANTKDAEHDLKIGYINDQITNLRSRMTSIETVIPRSYPQSSPQVVIQNPSSPTKR